MTTTDLQTFFTQPYDQAAWLKTIHGIFPLTEIFAKPQAVPVGDSRAKSVLQLGNTRLADDRGLAILEVAVVETTDLARNRVGLRNLVTKFIDQDKHHGVLAIFRTPQPNYRFTFVARETAMDEAGQVTKRETAPRRFTYLLGPGEACRTAAERFHELARKRDKITLRDLTDAFSVEKLNKDFFADFCRVFDRVRKDITARQPRWSAEVVEQQTQTLLNRLLFLCFIQRKGWLNRQRDFLVTHFRQHHAGRPDSTTYIDRFLRPVFEKLSTESAVADIADHDLPFLNGGLFSDEYGAEHFDEAAQRHKHLKVGNDTFQHVYDDLLGIYNFTIREDSPTDQEVAIDPEMLGKIFESLVLQIEKGDENSKSLRHDTGSHYTPRPIVHYLCIEGLRGWLEQFPPDPTRAADWPQRLEKLLAIDATDGIDDKERAILDACLTPEEAKVLLERLEKLRACDLAVGSGAFALGLIHVLVNLMRLCETRSRGKDPTEHDNNWLYDTKSRIIRQVIYGVDIQERAIEICKLRLWLSLMVDFDIGVDVDNCSRSAFRAALKRIPPLPNLDYKIRRADSLIDRVCGHPVILPRSLQDATSFNETLNKLSSAKLAFYGAHSVPEKRKHHFDILAATADLALTVFKQSKLDLKGSLIPHEDDLQRLKEIDQATADMLAIQGQLRAARKLPAAQMDEELQRIAAHFDNPAKPTFVWQLDFAEVFHRKDGAGFDLMLANPPYVRQEKITTQKPLLAERFACYTGTADLFVYFYERGLKLLSEGGVLSYISSNKFFRAVYGQKLRKFLREDTTLRTVIDFGDLPIFEATAYPCIVIASNRKPAPTQRIRTVTVKTTDDVARFSELPTGHLEQKSFGEDGWQLGSPNQLRLLGKLKRTGKTLGDLVKNRYYRGVLTGFNEAFVVDRITRDRLIAEHKSSAEILKPFLRGRDVKRWQTTPADLWLIFARRGVDINQYPAILDYLKQYKKHLEPGVPGGRKPGPYQWYEIQDITGYWEEFESAKIVYPDIAKRSEFALDQTALFPDCTLFLIPDGSTYLLAILNSAVVQFFFPQICPKIRGDFMRFKSIYMDQIPIPEASPGERTALSGLVERVLAAKRTDPQADVGALEQEINARVYRLYGLTKEEIKLVEESAKR